MKKVQTLGRPKGKNRAEAVLSVVATDNTFNPVIGRPGHSAFEDQCMPRQQLGWQGRCIHCNSHLFVTMQGLTEATLEHIKPLCNGGPAIDSENLALACSCCNNEKGIRHDMHAGKAGRADEVIATLQEKRQKRWCEPSASNI